LNLTKGVTKKHCGEERGVKTSLPHATNSNNASSL